MDETNIMTEMVEEESGQQTIAEKEQRQNSQDLVGEEEVLMGTD